MEVGTQAYRQTHTCTLVKAKGKVFDLMAIFTQNDIKVPLCRKELYSG